MSATATKKSEPIRPIRLLREHKNITAVSSAVVVLFSFVLKEAGSDRMKEEIDAADASRMRLSEAAQQQEFYNPLPSMMMQLQLLTDTTILGNKPKESQMDRDDVDRAYSRNHANNIEFEQIEFLTKKSPNKARYDEDLQNLRKKEANIMDQLLSLEKLKRESPNTSVNFAVIFFELEDQGLEATKVVQEAEHDFKSYVESLETKRKN
jgi:hypothetical protein